MGDSGRLIRSSGMQPREPSDSDHDLSLLQQVLREETPDPIPHGVEALWGRLNDAIARDAARARGRFVPVVTWRVAGLREVLVAAGLLLVAGGVGLVVYRTRLFRRPASSVASSPKTFATRAGER